MFDVNAFKKSLRKEAELRESKAKREFIKNNKRYVFVIAADLNDIYELKKKHRDNTIIINATEYLCKNIYKCEVIDRDNDDELKEAIFDSKRNKLYIEI